MDRSSNDFHDQVAMVYHLIFEDRDAAIDRQQAVLSALLPASSQTGTILDRARGIGTQAIGLAQAGHTVEGTDPSRGGIERAGREMSARGLSIPFRVGLRPQGTLPISLRDHEALMKQRPGMTEPTWFMDEGRRRMVHQVWDWQDDRRYVVHPYITRDLQEAGFHEVRTLQARETGDQQPLVVATR